MKKLMIGALLCAQLQVAAQPAWGAELEPVGDQRMGAFGGLRVRLPFGGTPGDRRLRAGLTLAPVLQDRFASGETRLRIGEGFEFGLRGRDPLHFSIAGRDVRRLDEHDARSGLGEERRRCRPDDAAAHDDDVRGATQGHATATPVAIRSSAPTTRSTSAAVL